MKSKTKAKSLIMIADVMSGGAISREFDRICNKKGKNQYTNKGIREKEKSLKYTLTVMRYEVPITFKYPTIAYCAKNALIYLKNDNSIPKSIIKSTGKIIWEYDGDPITGKSLSILESLINKNY